MNFEQLKQDENNYVMQTYGRFNVAFDHGKNAHLYDLDGNEYLDLTSGIGVNALGHDNPVLTEAICNQVHKVMETSNLYYTVPMVEAAKKLCNATGMKKVFFSNSGAEANEGLIKMARKYSHDKYGDGRNKILTLINSFHGRTITTLKATGQDHFHNHFFPFTEGFDYVVANDVEDLKTKMADSTVCAILVELIQGESGVRPLTKEFVEEIDTLCKKNDILLCVDEVQTGIGRTGKLFCYENYGLHPDIVSMAKALGGGVPIGGIMANEKTENVLKAGDHGSTFGANPLAASAANVILDTVADESFLKEVQEKGDYFMSALKKIEHEDIKDIRGMGLMIGVEVPNEKIGDYIQKFLDKNVLVLKAGSNTIRLLPPLTITYEDIDHAIETFNEVFA